MLTLSEKVMNSLALFIVTASSHSEVNIIVVNNRGNVNDNIDFILFFLLGVLVRCALMEGREKRFLVSSEA